ncbi:MAG: DNA mismatch repair protein MutS [Bacteroidales bacterium]|nr:DNA mismatch repair protein MutS [Bacteroidales bacterium]
MARNKRQATLNESVASDNQTPLMRQYYSFKAKYPEALLLFRVGDFYETYGEDAVKASGILGIVLTHRSNGASAGVEMAGFPYHALDTYLPKLVRSGLKVAICDQLEDPKTTKTLVKRGVTELVTPSVSYNDKVLETKRNNFLGSVHMEEKQCGLALLDISTGEFYISQGSDDYIRKLLQSFAPAEVVLEKRKREEFFRRFGEHYLCTTFEDWVFTTDFARSLLLRHFQVHSLKGFGVEDLPLGIVAGGAAMHYLFETQHTQIEHITHVARIEAEQYVWMDPFTIRNLELIDAAHPEAVTLFSVMDYTLSPMGSRMLRRWLLLPLKDKAEIDARLDAVEAMVQREDWRLSAETPLQEVGDLERLISKVAIGKANPREMLQMLRSLQAVSAVRGLCAASDTPSIAGMAEILDDCPELTGRIRQVLSPDAPMLLSKGGIIREGVDEELDQLRSIAYSGKDYLMRLQQAESERTGIPSLKIGYNNVFGYYLEVTNAHKDKVPQEWIRKQTLTNAERYITEELKEYESKILGAEEKIMEIEQRLYAALLQESLAYVPKVQASARCMARLDVLYSFATLAVRRRYVRPEINDSYAIDIKNGRHPVIEACLPPGEQYIANDVYMDNQSQQILMITGPNMSGKSALLRQVALIVLMAQTGSFVPADAASIGLTDKIFTRVGASDNLSSGESTFMVEMNETASILNNISSRSLVLLDEIGRGTSTFDGVSIAWAIAEYLHEHPVCRAKVLFATHYHELNQMASRFKRIKNFHVTVKEAGNRIIFLRKLAGGGTEHSFGIHVARMAGMPASVVRTAGEILKKLEASEHQDMNRRLETLKKEEAMQLSFVTLDDPLLIQIKEDILQTDIDTLTPVEALMKLHSIKKLLE